MKDKTDAKKIAAYKQNTAKLINDSLDWNKIKVDFVKLYTKNYSAEDMQGIIAFYKTAAGKKMLARLSLFRGHSDFFQW